MKRFLTSVLLLLPFSLLAQDPCSGVTITSVQYHPFTDTAIVVQLQNGGPGFFSYPGIVLINNNGDTLAKEDVNLFGIGTESTHILTVSPGVADPLDIFIGELELHTGFYDSLACSWPLNQSLCITENCADMVIGLQNWGGALVVGNFDWSVTDTAGVVLESGNMTMVDTLQFWYHTICAPPGQYIYTLEALTEPSGGGPYLTVSDNNGFGGPQLSAPLDWFNQTGTELAVPFFIHCANNNPNAVLEMSKHEFTIAYHEDGIVVSNLDGLRTLDIISIDGRKHSSLIPSGSSIKLPSDLSPGSYVLVGRYSDGSAMSRKVIRH